MNCRLASSAALFAIALIGCSQSPSIPPAQTGYTAKTLARMASTQYPPSEPNSLIQANGVLYGTTLAGGTYNLGQVFSATTGGQVTPVFSFKVGDEPSGRLLAFNKNLYGTTTTGAAGHRDGMLFGLAQSTDKEILSHYFKGSPSDGAMPTGGLRIAAGLLYGTTVDGGKGSCPGTIHGCGTIFEVNPQTAGVEFIVYNFQNTASDGRHPNGDMILLGGKLYGTTSAGGSGSCSGGCGTAFSFDPSTGQEKVIYDFQNNGTDATAPNSGLTNVSGLLYGTASAGPSGQGSVFEIDPKTGAETVLHSFAGGANDGADPEGGLTYLNGVLYGTTLQGGSANCSSGCGTVYQINLSSGQENVLYRFAGPQSDGQQPAGGVVSVSGTLYGTTELGGANARGALFSLSTTGAETLLYSF